MARTASSDPLEKFRFLVDFTVPGVTQTPVRTGFHDVQMPKRSTNKIAYREGQDADINTQSAGLSTFEDIVLSRGLLPAAGQRELYNWIRAVHKPGPGGVGYDSASGNAGPAAADRGYMDYRAELTIKMLDRAGTTVRAWKVYQAWPTNFVPGSDLNAAEDGDKSMEAITLCYEDFQELSVTGGVIGDPVAL